MAYIASRDLKKWRISIGKFKDGTDRWYRLKTMAQIKENGTDRWSRFYKMAHIDGTE